MEEYTKFKEGIRMTEEKKPRKKRKDTRIEKEYFEEIEVTDPSTGEVIIQKVKIVRYKAVGSKPIGNKGIPDEEVEVEELEYEWDEEDS